MAEGLGKLTPLLHGTPQPTAVPVDRRGVGGCLNRGTEHRSFRQAAPQRLAAPPALDATHRPPPDGLELPPWG